MPPSADDTVQGQSLAVVAEALYLINLLLFPGIAFLVLWWLYRKHARTAPPLARCHLRQTVFGSLWAGLMLVAVNLAIILLGGYRAPYTWVVVVLYFLTCHASLVLFGTLGLAKAMAGHFYRYPLIGVHCAGQDAASGA